MNSLRVAAARERRAPFVWWCGMGLAMGSALFLLTFRLSPHAAVLLAILLAGAWAAPVLAFVSMAAPRRARTAPPPPGGGSYGDWKRQARLLGKVLLYHEDNPSLPPPLKKSLHAGREDLRDTLKSHPLRDDLERVCERLRVGPIHDLKRWFWHEYRSRISELRLGYEQTVAQEGGDDERLIALQAAVEDAAALMVRRCMPRMLERERLRCATDCSWLAAQAASCGHAAYSSIDLAAALVVEWCDFSEPWLPARVLQRARERLDRTYGAPAPSPIAESKDTDEPVATEPVEAEDSGPTTRKLRRVRVRVRRGTHRHSRRYRGPSAWDILLSFGQWLRYSVRAWMLYR